MGRGREEFTGRLYLRKSDPSSVRLGVVLLICLILAGCGGTKKGSLSGRVSFGGQPIDNGGIRLDPVSGTGEPIAAKIVNGEYRFTTPIPVGEYKVFITAHRNTGERVDPELGQKVPIVEQYIPPKYNTQTQLSVKIGLGANSQDFDLTP